MYQVPEVRVQIRLQRMVKNPGPGTRDPGPGIRGSGFGVRDSGFGIQTHEHYAREKDALRERTRNLDSTSAVRTALHNAESKLHNRAACASVN